MLPSHALRKNPLFTDLLIRSGKVIMLALSRRNNEIECSSSSFQSYWFEFSAASKDDVHITGAHAGLT